MEYTAGNVYKAIDMLAPFGGCMAWDNVGLLVGEPDSAVTGILVTLDVTPAAVAQALEMRMNCIVSHHPIIFHPLKHISARDAAGLCLANGISVISAHTNYDFAPRGVNCALAQTLGLRNIRPFGPEDKEKPWYSIIVFVPKSHAEAVYRTMSEAGAGRQGNYSGCAYMNDGEGRFLPEAGAHPYLGKVGALEKAEETRLEMLCAPECLDAVIAAMRAAHPYEEPAYSILQNHALHRQEVYGMVGELPRPMRPEELAAMSETALNTRIQYVPTGREDPDGGGMRRSWQRFYGGSTGRGRGGLPDRRGKTPRMVYGGGAGPVPDGGGSPRHRAPCHAAAGKTAPGGAARFAG